MLSALGTVNCPLVRDSGAIACTGVLYTILYRIVAKGLLHAKCGEQNGRPLCLRLPSAPNHRPLSPVLGTDGTEPEHPWPHSRGRRQSVTGPRGGGCGRRHGWSRGVVGREQRRSLDQGSSGACSRGRDPCSAASLAVGCGAPAPP